MLCCRYGLYNTIDQVCTPFAASDAYIVLSALLVGCPDLKQSFSAAPLLPNFQQYILRHVIWDQFAGFAGPYIVGHLSNSGSYVSSVHFFGGMSFAAAFLVLGEPPPDKVHCLGTKLRHQLRHHFLPVQIQ